jgi:hypothetical protein
LFLLTWFRGSIDYERVHPLEGGFLRLKFRRDRRPGLALHNAWHFYPTYFAETVAKLIQWGSLYLRLRRIYLRIKWDPHKVEYTDSAIMPIGDDEEDGQLFQTEAAQGYVRQQRQLRNIRANVSTGLA